MSIFEDFIGGNDKVIKNVSPTVPIDTGLNPKNVSGYAKNIQSLRRIQQLPSTTTKEAVGDAVVKANTLSAQNFKLAELARQRTKMANEIARQIQLQQNYQQGMMATDLAIQRGNAQFGIKSAQHSIQEDVTQLGFSSYMEELNQGYDEFGSALNGF